VTTHEQREQSAVALHAYLESADPIDAETAIALLDIELGEARAVEPPLPVDGLRRAAENVIKWWDTAPPAFPEGEYVGPAIEGLRAALAAPIPTAPPALDDLERSLGARDLGGAVPWHEVLPIADDISHHRVGWP